MLCRKLVIKLGGSTITVKDKPYTLNINNIKKISNILGKYYKRHVEKGGELILIHGGGSYGHYAVKEVLRGKAVTDQVDVAKVQLAMLELSIELSKYLVENSIPITIIPGHVLCKDKPRECDMSLLLREIQKGLVPMTFGDAIYNEGLTVVSGDDLAILAASVIDADCLIFVTSVPGVLDKSGNVIRRLSSLEMVPNLGSHGHDVTGGMIAKLQRTFEFLRYHEGARAWIVDIDGLERLLEGSTDVGTLLSPSY